MKKLKLLIPTLSIASIATGIFTTTSCSNNANTIKLDTLGKIQGGDETFDCLTTKEKRNYEKDTTYTVIADASLLKSNDANDYDTHFVLDMMDSLNPPIGTKIEYKEVKIWADANELKQLSEEDTPINNSFCIHKFEAGVEIEIYLEKILSTKIIKAEFQITSSLEQKYLVFAKV